MKPTDSELHKELQRLSRMVRAAIWLSSASLALLLLLILFPRQAEWITRQSLEIQEWLGPQFAGLLGITIGLLVVVIAAAYVVSRVSPQPPSEEESSRGEDRY